MITVPIFNTIEMDDTTLDIIDYFLTNRCIWNYAYPYEVTSDGLINIQGDILITSVPDGRHQMSHIRFGNVSGNLRCHVLGVDSRSWDWFPNQVGGCVSIIYDKINNSNYDVSIFNTLYRYNLRQVQINNGISSEYLTYYQNRKRIDTINKILDD